MGYCQRVCRESEMTEVTEHVLACTKPLLCLRLVQRTLTLPLTQWLVSKGGPGTSSIRITWELLEGQILGLSQAN